MGSGNFTGHHHFVHPQVDAKGEPHYADGSAPASTTATAGVSSKRMRGRMRRPLQVVTFKDTFGKFPLIARLNSNGHKRRIRWTNNVSELYQLGAEVFPSNHPAMEVRHATRTVDNMRVVVKVREKKESFASAQEEKNWRISTEFMMNIPKSGSIVQLYDVLEDAKNYYVVMEKAGGMDLFETLDCHGRLPTADCKEIIRQLVMAVADLHNRGCIHKDLKLENVMVDRTPKKPSASFRSLSTSASLMDLDATPSPVVKIIDFDTVETQRSLKKQVTSVVGTDQYIAQEAYAGKYSPASDIFAVGVIAYRLLTGRFPFNPRIFDDEAGENWVGSPKMNQIRERLKGYDVDFDVQPFPSEPTARDLVRSMLAVEEKDRPQAQQALHHPWLEPRPESSQGFHYTSERDRASVMAELEPEQPAAETMERMEEFNEPIALPPGTIDSPEGS
mmetsp:Transcript_35359/g.101544  ORF Transcript_35359/g.101544 Transcript_35359/m.101544 type:complete len:446 (+) Transcript_35359:87-1424(+)